MTKTAEFGWIEEALPPYNPHARERINWASMKPKPQPKPAPKPPKRKGC